NPLFSEEAYQLTTELGETLYDVFDDNGQLSVSGEFFPSYYLGYGSSYPTLLGAVPFLFEQSSSRGMVQDSVNGLKRYDETISEQFQAAIALLGRAASERRRLQDFQQRWFASSAQKAADNPTKAYVFTSSDQGRFAHFLDLLNAHDIDVQMLNADLTVGDTVYPAESSAIVSLNQPRYALVEGLFAIQTPAEGRVVYYDISGWTLPHAFGLKHDALNARQAAQANRGMAATTEVLSAPSVPPGPDGVLAYVIDWSHFNAPKALNRFLRHELRAKVIPNPARIETPSGFVDVPRGAVLIPTRRQDMTPDEIYELVQKAVEDGVTVHASTTSRTLEGSDLGGFDVGALEAPKVLLLTGRGSGWSGVSDNDAGEVWHYLDNMLHISVTMIDITDVNASHFADHTHVIAVGGSYGAMSDANVKALQSWIRSGGVFVGTQQGAEWAVAKGFAEVEMLGVERESKDGEGKDKKAPDAKNEDEEADEFEAVAYADKLNYDREERITGAIFASVLDPTHPLGFGYDGLEIFVHKEGTKGFEPGENPFGLVVRYSDDPLASGYASDANLERLSGKGMLVAERVGQGSVILFADNPNFRGYWLGTKRLFSNSLFFGKSFARPAPRPDQ
ncbi:MAG: carboxypeptidase, partial [Pseudomonadota bacterium]